jgi:cysteinyl-tRNA synthetase
MQIFNTLNRKKELFQPIHPKKINMYVCGVTVYDHCHLGHARTYASIDVMVRYLTWCGYEVNYVRNITDIDDKIIKRALENNESVSAVTTRYTKAMHEDFAALSFLEPQHEPRATDYIPQMVQLIADIINNQHAYVGENGDVYFDVRSFPQYGCLSHHHLEELESGARVEISEAKRDPLDFVLWKLAKAHEPAWDSPWGKGRPGWHIECSAMSINLLGQHFDIHGGGRDLIFPHHENELAQAVAGRACQFANYWLHGGFLQIDKEKMSKSLGNFITIRESLHTTSPENLRYFLIASHYRSPLIYSDNVLKQCKQSLDRLYAALRFLPVVSPASDTQYEKLFCDAMDDDFNTPVALSLLFDLAHEIQRLRDQNKQEEAASLASLLRNLGGILGILQIDPDQFFQSGQRIDLDIEKIEQLIAERQQARVAKNWQEADRIRQILREYSVEIEDTAVGTTWKNLK